MQEVDRPIVNSCCGGGPGGPEIHGETPPHRCYAWSCRTAHALRIMAPLGMMGVDVAIMWVDSMTVGGFIDQGG